MKRLLFLFVFVIACTFSVPVSAAESITVNNVSSKDVHDFLVALYLKSGSTIQSSTDTNIVFDTKPAATDADLISPWGSGATLHSAYSLVPSGPDVIVSLEIQIVTDPGTASEKAHVASLENAMAYSPEEKRVLDAEYNNTLYTLRALKGAFNGIYRYGFTPVFKKSYAEVVEVSPHFSAEKAGLKTGDRIIKLNNAPVEDLGENAFDKIIETGDEGASINLVVLRDNKEIPLTLTKQFQPPTYKKVVNGQKDTNQHINYLYGEPTKIKLNDQLDLKFGTLYFGYSLADKYGNPNLNNFYYYKERVLFNTNLVYIPVNGVEVELSNHSDQPYIINWAGSSMSCGSFSGMPFLDGMSGRNAGNPAATPDTVIPPGTTVTKILYLSRVSFYDRSWYVNGELIPTDNSLNIRLYLKVADSNNMYRYYAANSPHIGLVL